jgi:hypothetical protein
LGLFYLNGIVILSDVDFLVKAYGVMENWSIGVLDMAQSSGHHPPSTPFRDGIFSAV